MDSLAFYFVKGGDSCIFDHLQGSWQYQVPGRQRNAGLQLPLFQLPRNHRRAELHKETATNQPSGLTP